MQLPWWGWTLLSVAGFSGTSLICTRLASARVSATTINVWLFTVGLLAFALHAWLTKADFRLPAGERWWLLPLAVTVFASNYAVVTAYRSSPNIGYVKAVGVGEVVLVALVVTGVALAHGRPLGLPWWKLAGIGLCIVGAVLVALEEQRPSPAQPNVAAADETNPGSESRTIPVTSKALQTEAVDATSCTWSGVCDAHLGRRWILSNHKVRIERQDGPQTRKPSLRPDRHPPSFSECG
jgi:hypothetical protein